MRRTLSIVATGCAVLALVAGAPTGTRADEEALLAYRQAYYDMEVVDYCGLVTDKVAEGFIRMRGDLRKRGGFDGARARRARLDASVAFDRERSNRNMAGYRAWCREEGWPAARRFTAYAAAGAAPAD